MPMVPSQEALPSLSRLSQAATGAGLVAVEGLADGVKLRSHEQATHGSDDVDNDHGVFRCCGPSMMVTSK